MERYRIAALVSFEWLTGSGEWRRGNGVTRDISSSELFILCYPVPVPGAPIKLRVEMPPTDILKRPIVLRGEGTVECVEPEIGQPVGCSVSAVLEDDEDMPDSGPVRPS